MSRTLTASERATLLRYAASLPLGSEMRRAVIAALKNAGSLYKVAGVLEDSVLVALRSGEVTSGPTVKTFRVTPQGIEANVEASVVIPATKETVAVSLPLLSPAQVTTAIVNAPNLLTMLPPDVLPQVSFAKLPATSYMSLVSKVIQNGLGAYSRDVLTALLEGRSGEVLVPDNDPSEGSMTSYAKGLVSGATPKLGELDRTYSFSVKEGVATLAWRADLEWSNSSGLKINADVKNAVLIVSKKFYPTKKSALEHFGLEGEVVENLPGAWKFWAKAAPKGSPGVVSILAFVSSHKEDIPLMRMERSQLEKMVVGVGR